MLGLACFLRQYGLGPANRDAPVCLEPGTYLATILSNTVQLKFWSTTVGRDKSARAVQYLARFLAWYFVTMGATKETVTRFSSIKSSIALSRKRTCPLFLPSLPCRQVPGAFPGCHEGTCHA